MAVVVIVPSVNFVSVDGEQREVRAPKSAEMEGVHAIHWHDNIGHIEYENPYGTPHDKWRLNETIDSIDRFQHIIELWKTAGPIPAGKINRMPPPPQPEPKLPPGVKK